MDEHKIYGFLEKIYIELQTTKTELKEEILNNRAQIKENRKWILENREQIQENRKQIQENREHTRKNSDRLVRLENEVQEKTGILFDAQQDLKEQGSRIEAKIDDFRQLVEDHEVRLRILEAKSG